jgi:predicted MFS family arabinose efflux permease
MDRRGGFWVMIFSAAIIIFGLLGFILRREIPTWLMGATAWCFIFGTAVTYFVARRITEGFANRNHLLQASTATYLVENCGIGVSALLAILFIEEYSFLLVVLDVFSTLFFCAFLYWISRDLKISEIVDDQKSLVENKTNSTLCLIGGRPIFVVGTLLLIVGCFSFMSALQVLIHDAFVDAKKVAAQAKFINTVTVVLVGSWIVYLTRKEQRQKTVLSVGVFLLLSGYLCLAADSSLQGVLIAMFLWSCGESICFPRISTKIISLFRADAPGIAVGTKDLVVRAGWCLAPIIGGQLQGQGSVVYSAVFGGLALIGFLLTISEFCTS